jgi:uncharacterized membrane protein YraQ (UPF0718 family)
MKTKQNKSFIKELKKAFLSVFSMLPMILAIVLIVGMVLNLLTPKIIMTLFSKNAILDTLIGTIAGAIAVGNALVSYIIGGELLKEGVSIFAVSAFILSWVTLGIVQLPAEMESLGKSFTIKRNILAFISTILIAILTVWITT